MCRSVFLVVLAMFLASVFAVGCVTNKIPCCCPAGGALPTPGPQPDPVGTWPPVPPAGLDLGTFDIWQNVPGTTEDLVGRIFVKKDTSPGVIGRYVQHWIVNGPTPTGAFTDEYIRPDIGGGLNTSIRATVTGPAGTGIQYGQGDYLVFLADEWFAFPGLGRLYTRLVQQDMDPPPPSPL